MRRFPLLSRLGYRWTQAVFELFAVALIRPGWQRSLVSWGCRRNLRRVKDPELRRGLTPDYQPMCKRLVLSNGFYKAMQRDNVELVTDAIDHVEPRGVVTKDGRLHELDVLVLATGFDAHAYMRPLELTGEDGLTLDEAWRDGRRAYRTVAVPGFPNFFMLLGPHSPVGNVSLITVAETQAKYVMRWIELWRQGRVATMAPTAEATARFNEELRGALPGTVWVTGCQSWYLDEDGTPELWPWSQRRHRDALREPVLEEFEVGPRRPRSPRGRRERRHQADPPTPDPGRTACGHARRPAAGGDRHARRGGLRRHDHAAGRRAGGRLAGHPDALLPDQDGVRRRGAAPPGRANRGRDPRAGGPARPEPLAAAGRAARPGLAGAHRPRGPGRDGALDGGPHRPGAAPGTARARADGAEDPRRGGRRAVPRADARTPPSSS